MKNKKFIDEVSNTINMNPLDLTDLHFFKIFSLPFWLVIMSIGLSFVSQSVSAENVHPYYRYIPYEGPTNTTGTAGQQPKPSGGASGGEAKKTSPSEQKTSETGSPAATTGPNTQQSPSAKEPKAEGSMSGKQKTSPVKQPEKDTGEFPSGKLPSFGQVDVNGDHYVTKDELQNFPELLQVFDKVDAGKDGRLEQHEYVNLEMETIREGEIL